MRHKLTTKNMKDEMKFMSRENLEMNTAIPTASINFEEYDPKNIDVWDNYIQVEDELVRVTEAIMSPEFPYLIESEKGQGGGDNSIYV